MPISKNSTVTPRRSPRNHSKTSPTTSTMLREGLLSPNFRSAAAMAGWDEEALLLATLVVEDTPVRESSRQKNDPPKLPPPPAPTPDSGNSSDRSGVGEEKGKQNSADQIEICEKKRKRDLGDRDGVCEEKESGEGEGSGEKELGKGIRCLEKLREELSCAICLEICFEPSTTPCGHSFCLKCLKRAAGKCGKKCPKCRQPISNGRVMHYQYCTLEYHSAFISRGSGSEEKLSTCNFTS